MKYVSINGINLNWVNKLIKVDRTLSHTECINILKNKLNRSYGIDQHFKNTVLNKTNNEFKLFDGYVAVFEMSGTASYYKDSTKYNNATVIDDDLNKWDISVERPITTHIDENVSVVDYPGLSVRKNLNIEMMKTGHVIDSISSLDSPLMTEYGYVLSSKEYLEKRLRESTPSTSNDHKFGGISNIKTTVYFVPVVEIKFMYCGEEQTVLINRSNSSIYHEFILSNDVKKSFEKNKNVLKILYVIEIISQIALFILPFINLFWISEKIGCAICLGLGCAFVDVGILFLNGFDFGDEKLKEKFTKSKNSGKLSGLGRGILYIIEVGMSIFMLVLLFTIDNFWTSLLIAVICAALMYILPLFNKDFRTG